MQNVLKWKQQQLLKHAKFGTSFIITRSLSDVFGKGDSSVQFDEYLKKASQASAKMCIALIAETEH